MSEDAPTLPMEEATRTARGWRTEARPPDRPELPDLELLSCIGRGAYGEVWLAQSATGVLRAVKIVRRGSFDQDRPFEREFEGIRRFEPVSRLHESQIDILHVGRGKDYFFYVMELGDDQATGGQINPKAYCPRTLRSDLNRRGRLPFEDCLSIALSLSAALQNLHEHGLVHRDIKPANIIFINGVAKLADVGLVTSVEATQSFVGTQGFVAPEGPGTPRADIYSFGKVLYEMCTGKDRQDFPELPTDLLSFPDADGVIEFNSIIARACRQNPLERYESAVQMLAEFEVLKSGRSIARLHALQRRLNWAMRAAAVLAFVVLAIGAGWFYHARQSQVLLKLAQEKARLAEQNARLLEFERLTLFREGVVRDPGKVVLFVGGPVTNPVNGHVYYLLGSDKASWGEPSARILGGTLATVRNAQENDWIFNTFGNWKGIPRSLLIGLHHPDAKNAAKDYATRRREFRWRSGEPVTYENWSDGEPNGWEGESEGFVHIWAPGSVAPGKWNDCADVSYMLGHGVHAVVEVVPKD